MIRLWTSLLAGVLLLLAGGVTALAGDAGAAPLKPESKVRPVTPKLGDGINVVGRYSAEITVQSIAGRGVPVAQLWRVDKVDQQIESPFGGTTDYKITKVGGVLTSVYVSGQGRQVSYKFTITGLKAYQRYSVNAWASGSIGPGKWSAISDVFTVSAVNPVFRQTLRLTYNTPDVG